MDARNRKTSSGFYSIKGNIMNEAQVILLLAGFVTTLLGLVGLIARWMIQRMDIKDERYAQMTKEDRDKFLEVTDRFVGVTTDFAEQTDMRAERFYNTAQEFRTTAEKFDATIREFMEGACANIEKVSIAQTTFLAEWEESRKYYTQAMSELFEQMATHSKISDKATEYLMGPFMERVRREHDEMLRADEMVIDATNVLMLSQQDIAKTLSGNQELVADVLGKQIEMLSKMMHKLDIETNGKKWDGSERRRDESSNKQ